MGKKIPFCTKENDMVAPFFKLVTGTVGAETDNLVFDSAKISLKTLVN